jgi:uncharacterized protein DUF2190
MRNEGLTKNLLAGAAIAKNRIVKFGADQNHVIQGAAATDKLIGVADNIGADAAEDRIDVIMEGIALVTYGGTVTCGDMLTSDATGRAVSTTTAANRVIGVAMDDGVVGDIGSVRISPSLI